MQEGASPNCRKTCIHSIYDIPYSPRADESASYEIMIAPDSFMATGQIVARLASTGLRYQRRALASSGAQGGEYSSGRVDDDVVAGNVGAEVCHRQLCVERDSGGLGGRWRRRVIGHRANQSSLETLERASVRMPPALTQGTLGGWSSRGRMTTTHSAGARSRS